MKHKITRENMECVIKYILAGSLFFLAVWSFFCLGDAKEAVGCIVAIVSLLSAAVVFRVRFSFNTRKDVHITQNSNKISGNSGTSNVVNPAVSGDATGLIAVSTGDGSPVTILTQPQQGATIGPADSVNSKTK